MLLSLEEVQVRECCEILINIVLQPNLSEWWFCHLHYSNNFNVTSVYNYILSLLNILVVDHISAIWNKEVNLKSNLFAWHLLGNRSPTIDNLITRHVLHPDVQFCIGGCDMMKDI